MGSECMRLESNDPKSALPVKSISQLIKTSKVFYRGGSMFTSLQLGKFRDLVYRLEKE